MQSITFTLVEQASLAHRSRHPGCIEVSDDFAGFEVEQLRMFDPIAFLAVIIESKAILDVPDMLPILINMIGQALAPMLPGQFEFFATPGSSLLLAQAWPSLPQV
jgi:hypothetical protein